MAETRPATILCIEDEPDLLEDLLEEIGDEGYIALGATNSRDALALLWSHSVDLVLCDQQLPGPSGLDFLEAAGTGKANPVFVLLTAYSDGPLREKALSLGAARVLVKPVDYDELLSLIRQLLA